MLSPEKPRSMTVSKAILWLLMAMTSAAVIAQMVISFSTENIACACIVLISVLVMLLYLNWTDAIVTNPISTFAIVGFCVTTQLGALIAQSIFVTAVTASLRQPLYTFGVLAFYQGIAVAVHVTYRVFSQGRRSTLTLSRNLMRRAGLYATPSSGQLW